MVYKIKLKCCSKTNKDNVTDSNRRNIYADVSAPPAQSDCPVCGGGRTKSAQIRPVKYAARAVCAGGVFYITYFILLNNYQYRT